MPSTRYTIASFAWLVACATGPHPASVDTARESAGGPPPVFSGQPGPTPRPPSDLDARLVQEYPLRGLVLQESGRARVRFTVAASGQVSSDGVVSATRPAYGEACGRVLAGSRWAPAVASGRNVAFSSVFDCSFEHAGPSKERQTRREEPHVRPPIAPDYGSNWFERYADETVPRDAAADLEILVDQAGVVHVGATRPGGDAVVARACAAALQQGPRWQPALTAKGDSVDYKIVFKCRVEVISHVRELSIQQVGAQGPIGLEQLSVIIAPILPQFARCFATTVDFGNAVQGQHWLALEIEPTGRVGRVEWVDPASHDSVLTQCVTAATRGARFPAARERTIADLQLYVGGLNAF